MKSFAILSFLALAEAAEVKVAWKDCGAAHGKTTSLVPDTITLGKTTTMTGSGTVDKAVSGGQFQIDLKASIIRKTFTGKVCEAKQFSLPLGTGTIGWLGLKCPIAAGAVSVPLDITLSSSLPRSLSSTSIKTKAQDTDGDDVLCVQINTSPAEAQEDEVALEGGWPAEVVV